MTWLQPKSNISIDQKTEQKGKYLWGADGQVKSVNYLYWTKGIRKCSIEDAGSQLEIRAELSTMLLIMRELEGWVELSSTACSFSMYEAMGSIPGSVVMK